ncbi:Outer membrane cobalamin receptor protein [Salinivirga cyanobacteriivorans]|uniref:Outer membrane cobalamin receptor protein n=1 Tax=Salinivirga cyanobacteriivorans TaxID=1307839 RepID=A0A0S2HVG9_9BACT|nr:TonB-dependent receptor [Salinivirga cyanobacteriivorans]ALO14049.1 Outer membrane cobalamin receptor protein [Salinivirga cyanobacteriivorans]
MNSIKQLLLLSLLIFFKLNTLAQTYSISGKVVDFESHEPLINVTVHSHDSNKGIYTNDYGYYSLILPKGKHQLSYSFVGYGEILKAIDLQTDTIINIALKPGELLQTVEVTANQNSRLVAELGAIRLNPQLIEESAIIFGEADLIKYAQQMPGVQGGHEGFSGMHVRGGSHDQNLILLDGVPVYNINHFFGLFSVFHPGVIKSATLYKSNIPARYRGGVSSVLDVRLREGNLQKYTGGIAIGLISSKINIEGPIKKDTASFLFAYRRTYLDLFTRPLAAATGSNVSVGYFFHDLNAKVNYVFSPKSRLYLSTYIGKDAFFMKNKESVQTDDVDYVINQKSDLGWGNITGVMRWNYIYSNQLFSNFTFSVSHFDFDNSNLTSENTSDGDKKIDNNYSSGIEELATAMDFDYFLAHDHYLRFGIKLRGRRFNPGIESMHYNYQNDIELNSTVSNAKVTALQYAVYIEDEWEVTGEIKASIGLNINGFYTDSVSYNYLEPRLAINWQIAEKVALMGSYNYLHQYLHLVTNSGLGMPTDLWVPSTKRIPPVSVSQPSLGISWQILPKVHLNMDAYYKSMHNVTEYRMEYLLEEDQKDWQNKLVSGNGKSYGIEILLEKSGQKTNAWLSYTLSKSTRTFEELNQGKPFPYVYDRRHIFNVNLTHEFNDHIKLNAYWVFRSGRFATFETNSYMPYSPFPTGNETVDYYGQMNNLQYPNYHRLDLSLMLEKEKKRGVRTWKIGLYNAYSQVNPFIVEYDSSMNRFNKIGIFPILPFISYYFKF